LSIITEILIVSFTPYFLERELLWFEKNFERVKELSKKQPFWQRNCFFLEKDKTISLTNLVQKLLDLGYERVLRADFPGEFSQQGGLINVFPINSNKGFQIEFFGNQIETIKELSISIPPNEKVRRVLKDKLKSQGLYSGLTNLVPGDYVVHLDHGVAKFAGMSKQSNNEQYCSLPDCSLPNSQKLRYYILEYAAGDKLYLPVGLERKLSRYVGFSEPRISRLGSIAWQKTKKMVKQEVEKFAKELLLIYAQREIALRPSYPQESDLERIVSQTFPYQETPDQIKALEEINKDLSLSKPMDRLLCGDVGFGKTEIALRTMVKAVCAGYQTMLLCPTTILAHQHFQTFKQRLKRLPINVAFLSRLQTKKQQSRICQDFKQGKIDILIGTHRLLSSDLTESVKDKTSKLGLLVIDDEQKFGVRQKEKLKKLRASLDILSMSATPIPRTLYLALSSLRTISFIQTPPLQRLAIKTFVLPWSEKIIKKAVNNELKRHGQIYYLHNRVQTIEKARQSLQMLLPGVKIGVVHGKLSENQILKTMSDFQSEKTNLLLATTIIENGLDLPNVNTLIVEDASSLGLAQAYQIKGRVGRFSKQAFAYFLYPPNFLRQKFGRARQRLDVLKQTQALGSGWQIAIKDLEIRGAGNILGKQQSGNINQVGLNLYCQILSDAVSKQSI